MLAVMRFSLYSVFLQSSLLMIGTYTSCSICDEEPPCFFAPHPVMMPSKPAKLLPGNDVIEKKKNQKRFPLSSRFRSGRLCRIVRRRRTFDRHAHRIDAGVLAELHAFRVHSQQRDVVVVRGRVVPFVLNHSRHLEVDVFRFRRVAAVVFQEPDADVLPLEPVRESRSCISATVIRARNCRRDTRYAETTTNSVVRTVFFLERKTVYERKSLLAYTTRVIAELIV